MNPFNLFRKSRSDTSTPYAHMTWARSSVGRSVSRTGIFLKKQIWMWPIVALLFLTVLGLTIRSLLVSNMQQQLASQLQTLLNVETAMLSEWLESHRSNAEILANSVAVRNQVYQLLDKDENVQPETEINSNKSIHRQLQAALAAAMSSHDYVGFFIADKKMKILSASTETLIGQQEVTAYQTFISRALEGESVVSPPFASVTLVKTESGEKQLGLPVMYVCVPVRNADFQVVAVLALQIQPEKEFTQILQLGRIGESGETYAFNKDGLMVSGSRFDDDLILLGLIPDKKDARSLLEIQIRDPGGNITAGYRPQVRRSEMPLTRMAEDAIAGNSNVDVVGYNDYRGVPVIGAWKWMSDIQIGVATEIDYAEAYRPLTILQRTFYGLFVLLGLSSVAIFIFTVKVAQLRRESQKAAIEAQQLGQYELEEKLGVGGMGVVYKGRHAMLRRATAIKMLDVDKVNDASIKRFEHEVQITCQLNHPNTIAIYDYGRTPEGVFYYAMEYLDGLDLQALVEEYGPQSESRVVRILLQICGSLFEAHSLGLVHRDIKPANVMLNRRGSEPDVVKVLDFGLVKAMDEQKQTGLTATGSLTGTPLYMSPEAIQSPNLVDARSDLYAVGAIGYFLITGSPVFEAESIVELCRNHVSKEPESLSDRLGKTVSAELEGAILACLEKSPFKRPQTARDLANLLKKCTAATAWNAEEADLWWGRHERTEADPETKSGTSTTYDHTIISNNTENKNAT